MNTHLLWLIWTILGNAGASTFSITMDDPNSYDTPKFSAAERDDRVRASLKAHNHKAALFVCGMRVNDAAGRALLKRWSREGHALANHSFSHLNFNAKNTSIEAFWADVRKADSLISSLPGFVALFRFPFLKEGDTVEKRDAMRAKLATSGYRLGHVSVDASDWYISSRLEARLKKDPHADTTGYRDFYLAHLWDRAQYYDELAKKVVGREIAHTLLVHHNLLNALYLGELIAHFKAKGWELIDAKRAFEDSVYASKPKIAPAGESVVWALAKETGKYELRYPAEDGDYEKPKMDALGL